MSVIHTNHHPIGLFIPPPHSGFSLRAFFQSSFAPLAAGFASIHPKMEQALRNIGIKDYHVSQGWGHARASAGYHSPVGWVNGHRYSTCVDLRTSIGCTPEMRSRLVAAGFAPFFRLDTSWRGNEHVHCVYVGDLPLLSGPLQQAYDYAAGLNGLVGHAPLRGPLAPTQEERKSIAYALKTKVPHVAVKVLAPNGKVIPCYAFLERFWYSKQDKVRCEVRPFVEYWGAVILDQKTFRFKGGNIAMTSAQTMVSGQFLRGNLRELAGLLGLKVVKFELTADGTSATVRLGYK